MDSGSEFIDLIEPKEYDALMKKIRKFFNSEGLIEAHVQHRLSILAACEDPKTIATFIYDNKLWPLPQTGQMWLELELLNDGSVPGYFCVTTSYRNEQDPVVGRHQLCFPLIDFEIKGDMEDLINLEQKLLEYLGFGEAETFPRDKYINIATKYGVKELDHVHEKYLQRDYGNVFFLTDFPNYSSPFWNMQQNNDGVTAKKVDVIINGVETIGSAERSLNPEEMRKQFLEISNGDYANLLFTKFGKQRVLDELNKFLQQKFIKRSGGGIGLTRLIKAIKYNEKMIIYGMQ